jgi:hypothetical protein
MDGRLVRPALPSYKVSAVRKEDGIPEKNSDGVRFGCVEWSYVLSAWATRSVAAERLNGRYREELSFVTPWRTLNGVGQGRFRYSIEPS